MGIKADEHKVTFKKAFIRSIYLKVKIQELNSNCIIVAFKYSDSDQ